mgnify:CR=1 FL=1
MVARKNLDECVGIGERGRLVVGHPCDPVFRHGERYYLVDYKGNHLGSRASDYTSEALGAAMAAGQSRPIFYRPSVIFVTKLGKYALSFGTGDREDLWNNSGATGRFFVFVASALHCRHRLAGEIGGGITDILKKVQFFLAMMRKNLNDGYPWNKTIVKLILLMAIKLFVTRSNVLLPRPNYSVLRKRQR